jgi:hypothetical protein
VTGLSAPPVNEDKQSSYTDRNLRKGAQNPVKKLSMSEACAGHSICYHLITLLWSEVRQISE